MANVNKKITSVIMQTDYFLKISPCPPRLRGVNVDLSKKKNDRSFLRYTLRMSMIQVPSKESRPDKGAQTKTVITDAALRLASQIGLEGLSIGAIAEVTQMSKSGVFAHFGSREELQISVVREYFMRFERDVFTPTLSAERGLPRLRSLFANWMLQVAHEIQSGCIFISGAVEFDDRSGPVRDALEQSMKTWLAAVRRCVAMAIEEGHLAKTADPKQVVFELHGLILALHYEAKFIKSPRSMERAKAGFDNLLTRYKV
jgi:AcrR family transcriptional regulator